MGRKKDLLVPILLLIILLSTQLSLNHVAASPVIGSSTTTIYSVADAHVNSSSPDTNYGSLDHMYVSANSEQDFAYVKFDLSSIPPDANIISAKLKLYLSSTGGDIYWYPADKIGAYHCSDSSWTEQGITWDNKPIFNSEPTHHWSFSLMYRVKVYKSWDITEDVSTSLPSGNLTEVLKFKSKTGDGYAVFQSGEGANKPKLEIEYAVEPVFAVSLESVQETGATVNIGLITFAGETFSLPTDIDVVNGSYTVSYSGGYKFVRWETTGGVTVSNEDSESTMVNVLGNGTLRVVGSVGELEYAYDHGNPQSQSENVGEIDAVRFTPLFSGQLLKARFYMYYISSYWTNTFKVHIMDEHRDALILPFNVTPTFEGWFDIDLSAHNLTVNDGEDFYIGMEWIVDYNPDLGEDRTNVSYRSWHWNGTSWKEENYSDFMIRAVVLLQEISYDDGEMEDSRSYGGIGHAVKFSPPNKCWTIDKVKIYGRIHGQSDEDRSFVIEIWDENKITLQEVGPYNYTEFFSLNWEWITVDIPDMKVDNDFYFCFYANTTMEYGVSVGYDANNPSNRSFTGDKATHQLEPFEHNWMMRIKGIPDRTAPTISILFPENKTYTTSSILLTFTVNEATSWIGYSLDSQTNVTITGNTTLSGIPDGSHYIIVYANDTVGNMGTSNTVHFTINQTQTFHILLDTTDYTVTIHSNSTIADFVFNQSKTQISFNVDGSHGTVGFCNVTVPKSLMKGNPWIITIKGDPPTNYTSDDNTTHTFLYFTYAHLSTLQIVIKGTWVVQEFPSLTILLLFMMITLLTVAIYRSKHSM